MLTAYFNGEVVRSPDQRAAKLRMVERRELNHVCTFGQSECNCSTFLSWQLEKPDSRLNIRCPLASKSKTIYKNRYTGKKLHKPYIQYRCIRAKRRNFNSKKKKKYVLDGTIYRKLASAAHHIVKNSTYKTLFLTLTFPKYRKNEITENQANECFSKFAENIRKNYGCEHYLAVRERGTENNRLHFHIVLSIPYVSFRRLNSAWCHAVSAYCYFAPNALQTDKKKKNYIIRNPHHVIRYICKYISKSIGQESKARLYFISNKTLSTTYLRSQKIPYQDIDEETGEITMKEREQFYKEIVSNIRRTFPAGTPLTDKTPQFMLKYKGVQINTFEYVTVFKITDTPSFNSFCHLVLYPLFGSAEKMIHCTFNPDESARWDKVKPKIPKLSPVFS